MKLLIGVWFLTAFASFSSPVDNFPKIRGNCGTDICTYVRKFDDGPNTCYVAESTYFIRTSSVSISCVKR